MTMHRAHWCRLLMCLAALAIGVAVGVYLLLPRSAINRENVKKLQPGMTLAEVEAILGGPARDETTGKTHFDYYDEGVLSPDRHEWPVNDGLGTGP